VSLKRRVSHTYVRLDTRPDSLVVLVLSWISRPRARPPLACPACRWRSGTPDLARPLVAGCHCLSFCRRSRSLKPHAVTQRWGPCGRVTVRLAAWQSWYCALSSSLFSCISSLPLAVTFGSPSVSPSATGVAGCSARLFHCSHSWSPAGVASLFGPVVAASCFRLCVQVPCLIRGPFCRAQCRREQWGTHGALLAVDRGLGAASAPCPGGACRHDEEWQRKTVRQLMSDC